MDLPPCPFRRLGPPGGRLALCAHPRVHARDDLVPPEVCRLCGYAQSSDPPKAGVCWPPVPRPWVPRTAAVVVPCHDYGRFLGEALESALRQTRPPAEVVVIDDASADDTPAVAASFRDRGVRYVRVECRHSQRARRAGFEATGADVLCFLDADDALAPDYLEQGMAAFDGPQVGVVYSDVEYFGLAGGRSAYPAVYRRHLLERANFLHTGSLVLREALAISRALEVGTDDRVALQDWLLWRRVLQDGWEARKQAGLYRYRQHGRSMIDRQRREGAIHDYFSRAALAREVITLFVPLAGRKSLWPGLAAFLGRQAWPHDQVQLVLLDTSQDAAFGATVRAWVAGCDYPDVRHVRQAVGEPGLADRDRRAAVREATLAMARIYNRLARLVTTDYVWVVEDDVLPPDDACERLLRGFDERTASVSAAYRSRFGDGYVAWEHTQQRFLQKGQGLQRVGGNGFGCVVLRGSVVRDTVFTATIDYPAYDNAFYHRLFATGLEAKVDWSVECEHRAGGA
ncbi:MAG TPA: glycosyltransferase family 2 protein [Gemmataceae bacterium]|nr:glycosyltransferase family 2 protein [Gemmataceae bacterium]